MELSVQRDDLYKVLHVANSICEKRNTIPIIANVRLDVIGDKLNISATDLELSLVGEIEASIKTPGSITIPAKVIYEILKEIDSDRVVLKVPTGQRCEVEAGQSRFKIHCVSAEEYPKIVGTELIEPVMVDAAKLAVMLEKTAYAASIDESRRNIYGVCIESLNNPVGKDQSGIRCVATDGHRLVIIDRPADGLTFASNVIIPRKGVPELLKILEGNESTALLSIKKEFITVQSGAITLGVRLIEGDFPDYRKVIPVSESTTIRIERTAFISALKRVSLVTTDKSRTIKLKIVSGNMLISSSSQEHGEASETLTIAQDGEDIAVGFSARYMIEVLNAMSDSDEIIINLHGGLGPGVFKGNYDDYYSCILMPMRFE